MDNLPAANLANEMEIASKSQIQFVSEIQQEENLEEKVKSDIEEKADGISVDKSVDLDDFFGTGVSIQASQFPALDIVDFDSDVEKENKDKDVPDAMDTDAAPQLTSNDDAGVEEKEGDANDVTGTEEVEEVTPPQITKEGISFLSLYFTF